MKIKSHLDDLPQNSLSSNVTIETSNLLDEDIENEKEEERTHDLTYHYHGSI